MADPAVVIDPVTASLMVQRTNQIAEVGHAGVQLYAENLRYDYLIAKGRVDYAQATAVRHVEESGSGRARILDVSNAAPAKAS